MALIKGGHAGGLVKGGFRDLGELKHQTEQVLERAQAEAARILEEARAQAESLVAESAPRGFDEGLARGLDEGREQGRSEGRSEALEQHGAELERLVGSWKQALERFESQRAEMLLAAREDILALAVAMGEKITRRVIEADPAVVNEHVAEALGLVAAPTGVTLSVNPGDRKLVESVLGEVLEAVGRCEHVDLRDDPEIARGGCIVTTGSGRIDASVERQIERITDTLLPRRKKS